MSLQPQAIPPIPEETARVARALFPKGNRYLCLRDELGTIYTDEQFAALYPATGQLAEQPWRIALVLVMQYMENYTDRQAAEAMQTRIDWKYVLSLELTDPGFDFSVLCEFRQRLLESGQAEQLLDTLLALCRARGWLKPGGKQRTDSTHVLSAIRQLNRLELVGETLRAALNSLAAVVPVWVQEQVPAEWYERYGSRIQDYHFPKQESQRHALAQQMGEDGCHLLALVDAQEAPAWLREVPAVQMVRRVWVQQYGSQDGQPYWRPNEHLPPSSRYISSPYDPDAHLSIKRSTTWLGYKVHLTETCDEDRPHLLIHVETTAATTQDVEVTEPLHRSLCEQDLLPAEHLVDSAYVDGGLLLSSQEQYGVEVLGPILLDPTWQGRAGQGFSSSDFVIDWQAQQVTCPQGQTSRSWRWTKRGQPEERIQVSFDKQACLACPCRSGCTRATANPRRLSFYPQRLHETLQAARTRQSTQTFRQRYAMRAGIEGTISQGVRAFDLRRSRYRGQAKTHLQHVLIAAALDVSRILAFLMDIPRDGTRISRFAALAP